MIAATPLVGDFDGEGHTDVAIWDSTRVQALLDSTGDGRIDGITPAVGISTDLPFIGDWDGDGKETLALYRKSSNQVIYRNTNNTGTYAVRTVNATGAQGGLAIRGDWNGDGVDGFAIYDIASRTFTFYQTMSSTSFSSTDFGNPGDIPLSGDWDGNGTDGFGIYRPSTREFWLTNSIGDAPSYHIASVGNPGDIPLTGKWHGQSNWSVGLYRPSTKQFFLYNTLSVSSLQTVAWLDPVSVVSDAARQTIYTSGVPHVSTTGSTITSYSPTQSFLLLGIYGVGTPNTEAGTDNAMFTQLAAAGFNVAKLWFYFTVDEAVAASAGTNVKLIPRFTPPDNPEPGFIWPDGAEFRRKDGLSNIFAWETCDEPTAETCKPGGTGPTFHEIYAISPAAIHPLYHTNVKPPQPSWDQWAVQGYAGAVDDYPILTTESPRSVESVANSVATLRATLAPSKAVWFVAQAFSLTDDPVLHPNSYQWGMPTPAQYKAMVYTAFVHGASGIVTFGRDGFDLRSGGNLGISPDPFVNYDRCWRGDRNDPKSFPCDDAKSDAIQKAKDLWNGMAEINAGITALKPALLSPTSTMDYTVDLLQTPNYGSNPIRTLLKTSPSGSVYLIAVNMLNDNLDPVIQLPTMVSSVNVQGEARTIATPLSAIRDHFLPFEVHIYSW